MPGGWHFHKPDKNARRMRRWWPFEVAAVIAIAVVVVIGLIGLTGGQAPNRVNPRTTARAGEVEHTAAQSRVAPSTTSVPVDPYLQPDGSALPVLVVFNGRAITIKGAIPSAASEQRLAALAEAYSKTPHAKLVTDFVVDPRVPTSTGVRVIEMNSVRFAEGGSEVTQQYAPALARVVTIMKAIPSLTALVVGHSDQMGASSSNLALSYARATSVVAYLASQGINADRLTAQGVGSESLLTKQSNAAGLALNRRTEFVLYGLLSGPPGSQA